MMNDFDWRTLKSGTDLRGIASGDPLTITLTVERARQIGRGFGVWLAQQTDSPLTVAVGRDSRISGETLSRAVREGLCASGARVLDAGLCTTPAMFEITQHPKTLCDGAVMVTASHLPSERNGFKFIIQTGGLDGRQIDELLQVISDQKSDSCADTSEKLDFLPYYLEGLTSIMHASLGTNRPLVGLRVVVDASGGSGGFYERWLAELGADTTGSLYLQPDGLFSGHVPNPENSSAMDALSKAVVSSGADIGVILDADCDRAALAAHDGSALNRERLIALCADMVIRDEPGATIVTDSVTSPALTRFIKERGGKHRRWKRGYRNVITEAQRLNAEGVSCPLAMETSGHAAFRFNRFLDDGMMLATLLIIQAVAAKRKGGLLTDRVASLKAPLEDAEWRIRMESPADRLDALERAREWFTTGVARHEYVVLQGEPEGVRVERADGSGWFLLRSSLHDPLLVWNAQSDTAGGVALMREDLTKCMANPRK